MIVGGKRMDGVLFGYVGGVLGLPFKGLEKLMFVFQLEIFGFSVKGRLPEEPSKTTGSSDATLLDHLCVSWPEKKHLRNIPRTLATPYPSDQSLKDITRDLH